jgi:hypothetical protein
MKYRMTLILLSVLALGGCAKTIDGSYCDISEPVYFNTQNTIDWLAENDPVFLRDTIIRNEIWSKLCNG